MSCSVNRTINQPIHGLITFYKQSLTGLFVFGMIVEMKYILLTLCFLLTTVSQTSAYELSVTEVDKPYDVVPIVLDEESQKVVLGSLDNFPIMYEVEVDATTTLSLRLQQLYRGGVEPTSFALMVVRQNDEDGGVSEVARFYPESDDWIINKDSELGLTLLEGEIVSRKIGPGVYNVEVSTPENIGKFSLAFGKEIETVGYLERLAQVRTTQSFFGYSVFKMLSSSFIYYPLGIIFILFIINRTRKYKKIISNVS